MEEQNKTDMVARIKKVFPITWGHINLGGRFKLTRQKETINIEQMLDRLKESINNFPMLHSAADENLNYNIVKGLIRRKSDLNIVRIQDVGLSGKGDATVLEWAAQENRILIIYLPLSD